MVRHGCPEGQYNDLGTALQGSAVWVIRSLLSLGSDNEPVNNRVSASHGAPLLDACPCPPLCSHI